MTRTIRYLGSDAGGTTLAPDGPHFPHGEPVEVDDEVAARLLARPDFDEVKPRTSSKGSASARSAGRDVETR